MLKAIIGFVLNWLFEKLSGLVSSYFKNKEVTDNIHDKNKADREVLENSETKEDRDEAAKRIIDDGL